MKRFLRADYLVIGFLSLILVDMAWTVWLYQRATVAVVNRSGTDISNIRVKVAGDVRKIGRLRNGSSRAVHVCPPGESDVSLSFDNPDRKTLSWEGGYLECNGWHQLMITIGPNYDVSARYGDTYGFLILPGLVWVWRSPR